MTLLLHQLGQLDSREAGWNEVMRALSAAAALTPDPIAADAIHAALRMAVARADPASIHSGTAAALRAGLT